MMIILNHWLIARFGHAGTTVHTCTFIHALHFCFKVVLISSASAVDEHLAGFRSRVVEEPREESPAESRLGGQLTHVGAPGAF